MNWSGSMLCSWRTALFGCGDSGKDVDVGVLCCNAAWVDVSTSEERAASIFMLVSPKLYLSMQVHKALHHRRPRSTWRRSLTPGLSFNCRCCCAFNNDGKAIPFYAWKNESFPHRFRNMMAEFREEIVGVAINSLSWLGCRVLCQRQSTRSLLKQEV
jgi:hypothetical protein